MINFSTSRNKKVDNIDGRCTCLYIPTADDTPRWIWPAASNRPVFLQFIQPTTWRQSSFVYLMTLIFALRLQRLLLSACSYTPPQNVIGDDWAIFTGTPGPNRKQVIINAGRVTKLATGTKAATNLKNEAIILEYLNEKRKALSFSVPRLHSLDTSGLTMEKLPHRGTWRQFTKQHAAALQDMRLKQPVLSHIEDWNSWSIIETRLYQLKQNLHAEIPPLLIEKLTTLFIAEETLTPIHLGLTHGDFTPWNTLRLANNQLAIIDWELADPRMPLGFDFFHFHLQKGIMLDRKSWSEINKELQASLTPEFCNYIFGTDKADINRYLRLYLLYHCSYYLTLYQQQATWHQQIYWQLEVWLNALDSLAPADDQRKDIISRLFNKLAANEYAVLKMEQEDPLLLPANSDLDIIIKQKDAKSIITFLKNCPGLAQCKVFRKSFMASLFLLTQDGQILSVDLIWQLKRKATIFMNAGSIINNARLNSHGISVVSPADTKTYLWFFYGLNSSRVPAKFKLDEEAPTPLLKRSPNSGLNGLKHQLLYLLDTLRTMLFDRGFILTFSGVDGAGKSTVIEQVVHMLDKQFRRPVKVLRHRPSILPILSAFRYGKTVAEQRSVASLPRTGGNTNPISSILRFSYYYSDYLLGQWYIYFRYVLRGYVVVYDRYYYDFMVDGRRSNLQLPAFITSAGFLLILKPAFNFFLFASPDTILARKQELSRETIVSLTQRYHSLFANCEKNYRNSRFTAIHNVQLKDTVADIRTLLLHKTAR